MHAVLKQELTADPLGRGYAGMDAAAAAASLNASDRENVVPIPHKKLLRWAVSKGMISRMREAQADTGLNHIARSAAAAVLLIVETPDSYDIDPGDPEIVALIQVLVSAGVITAPEVTGLRKLGDELVSRGLELGIGHVKVGHVMEARA